MVKQLRKLTVERPQKQVAQGKQVRAVALPTVKSKAKESLSDYSILLYGEEKIGKTTLAAAFPSALMLFFEPGGKALDAFQLPDTDQDLPFEDWNDFLRVIALLKDGKHNFQTVVIDTVDACYRWLFNAVCAEKGISHPGDLKDHGKTWGYIRDMFNSVLNKLLSLPMGVVFISHAQEKEIERRIGGKYDRIVPTIAKQGRDILTALVDCMFYYEKEGKQRYLVIEGDDLITAGTRIQKHFLDSKTGKKLERIPMGSDPNQAYNQLTKAFDNGIELVVEETKTTPVIAKTGLKKVQLPQKMFQKGLDK